MADLERLVSANRYVRVDTPKDLPQSLQPYASGRSKSVIIASSNFVCSSTHTGLEYTPSGRVYVLRNYRYCEHDRSPHFNADDIAFWTDCSGRQWKASSKDAPDHYQTVVAGTTVSDVWSRYYIPVASSGAVEDFRKKGAHLDFVEPCPGLAHRDRDEESL